MKLLSCLLLFFSIVATTSPSPANDVAPPSIKGAETIDAQEAKKLHEANAVFIDLRMDEDFATSRIPNAISMNIAGSFYQDALEKVATRDDIVVFYCYGRSCMRSASASRRAVQWGFKHIKYFRTGLPAWKKAGFPIESNF